MRPAGPSPTDAVLAPAVAQVTDEERRAVRDRLTGSVPGAVDALPPGDQIVLTLPLLRRAAGGPENLPGSDEPFAWKPAFVRRSLGLAAVDGCIRHGRRTPVEAVTAVADGAVAEWRRTGWRTFHWEPWLAGLGDGARAVVLADAVTWATALWSSLEWHRFDPLPEVGGPDDRWTCPAARTVRLQARTELRVPIGGRSGGRDHDALALVSVATGLPSSDWAAELGFLALVAAVRSPSRPVPARVVGLWPDGGVHRAVDVDGGVLHAATDRVLAAVEAVVAARLGAGSIAG